MTAFLYEVKNSLYKNESQKKLLFEFYKKRKDDIVKFAKSNLNINERQINKFLKSINAEW